MISAGVGCLAAHSVKLVGSIKGLFAVKAGTEATATAYTAATTAASATSSTAAAAATTSATATATAATTTTTSTAGWLTSLAMTPVGFAVIGVAAGCVAYCAYVSHAASSSCTTATGADLIFI